MAETKKRNSVPRLINSDDIKVGDLTYTTNVIKVTEGGFGQSLDFNIPDYATSIIIAYNKGTGLKPYDLCLTHQVYVDKIEKLLKEEPGTKEIVIIPIRSEDYMTILKK